MGTQQLDKFLNNYYSILNRQNVNIKKSTSQISKDLEDEFRALMFDYINGLSDSFDELIKGSDIKQNPNVDYIQLGHESYSIADKVRKNKAMFIKMANIPHRGYITDSGQQPEEWFIRSYDFILDFCFANKKVFKLSALLDCYTIFDALYEWDYFINFLQRRPEILMLNYAQRVIRWHSPLKALEIMKIKNALSANLESNKKLFKKNKSIKDRKSRSNSNMIEESLKPLILIALLEPKLLAEYDSSQIFHSLKSYKIIDDSISHDAFRKRYGSEIKPFFVG